MTHGETTFDSDNSGQDRPQIAGMDDGLLRSRLREMPNEELCGLLREAALPVLVSYDEIQTQTAIGHEAMARLIERSGSRSGSLRPQSLQTSACQSIPARGILVTGQVNHTATGPVFVASAEPPAIHWRVGLKNGDRIISDLVMAGDIVSAIQQASARNLGAMVISAKEDQPAMISDQDLQALLQRNSQHAQETSKTKSLTFSLMLSRALRGETPYIYGVSIQRDGYLEQVVATVTALSSPHAIQQVTERFPQGMEITLIPSNVFIGIQRFVAHPCRAARWIFSHREMASREYKAVLSVLGIQAVKCAWKEIQHGLAPGIGPVATDTQAASSLPDHEAAAPVTVRNPISTDEHAAN